MLNISTEMLARFGVFAAVLALMACAERLAPRRPLTALRTRRWFGNLSLAGLNIFVLRIVFPLGLAGLAAVTRENGWGLLNAFLLPAWLSVLIAVVVLDFLIYLQHVLFHAVPWLWRLHRVHHTDVDFDVTTGIRFHTLEILLSLGIKLGAVLLLGPSPLAVVIFEVLLNASSLFNHGNLRLPAWLDGALRKVLVTPDMHRVHHSIHIEETNSNFGFTLPWWDHLLGTYRAQPQAGHEDMAIGLAEFRDEKKTESLPWMLTLPLLGTGARGEADPPLERHSSPG